MNNIDNLPASAGRPVSPLHPLSSRPTPPQRPSTAPDSVVTFTSTLVPPSEVHNAPAERQLNVTDALSYLDSVKVQFQERPDVYNRFLDIMKDFKGQLIDTPGVIERVSNLFHGHPSLIQGFNTFLPAGYRIDCTTDVLHPNFITVTTPAGTTTQSTNSAFVFHSGHATIPEPVSESELQPALNYIHDIRLRYSNDPDTYHKVLELLSQHAGKQADNVHEMESFSVAVLSAGAVQQSGVIQHIARLLKDAPELVKGLVTFFPEAARWVEAEDARGEVKSARGKRGEGSTTVAQKRKRKEKEVAPKPGPSKTKKARQVHEVVPPSPRHVPAPAPPQEMAPPEDLQFFERVKRAVGSRETYNEFLKLVNLFTQDIIDTGRFIRESVTFLGDGELMMQLKMIVGWDERRYSGLEDAWTRPTTTLERPSRNQLNAQYGSYRKLPENETQVPCSGRDPMCWAVLNDEWVSQATFVSEDGGFLAHKKNVYEEALHRSEEERHEYDFHIDAVYRTIQMLEPLNNKIGQLNPDEHATFKLKPNLGGLAKSFHQRVIKKIYGREAGMEVFQAMQEIPAVAVPLVLSRLKQKHEEWKRAQREWNKVWREVDARNYYKSLDHQGVTFKATDKKAITVKSFVNQIEVARDEQMAKRAALIDPLFARTRPRHQLEYVLDDVSVLQDVLKLTFSFLDRMQGQIPFAERRKIEGFLRTFAPLFFMLEPVAFNSAFVAHHEMVDSDMSEGDSAADDTELASAAGSSRAGRNGRKGGAAGSSSDLRKKLLKSEQAKSSRRTRAREVATPSGSRRASPAVSDAMQVEADGVQPEAGSSNAPPPSSAAVKRSSRRGNFFTNTTFYALFRLLELLYSRLLLFKRMGRTLTADLLPNPASAGISLYELAGLGDTSATTFHFYDVMLEACEKLFDNEIEQHVFEDQMRYMFGTKEAYKIFTVDKVIGALVKQVQNVLSDTKSQELFELLRREREIISPTTQDLINCRKNTERVLGPDENIFRIDWYSENKMATIQLLGKDEASGDDDEVLTQRWLAYMDAFSQIDETSTIRRPFLRRSKLPEDANLGRVVLHDDLQIRVCMRTYRLFYTSRSEDFLWRRAAPPEEQVNTRKRLDARNARRAKWLEDLSAGKPVLGS